MADGSSWRQAIFPQRSNAVSESTRFVLRLKPYGLKVMHLHGQEQVLVIRSLATKLITPPLREFLKKCAEWGWQSEHDKAIESLKACTH